MTSDEDIWSSNEAKILHFFIHVTFVRINITKLDGGVH